MARFKMEDGTVVDTDKATQAWNEYRTHDGRNFISKATGSQWDHQKLHRSRKGRFYLVHSSDYQGSMDSAEWISQRAAVAWLVANEREVPEDLKQVEADVVE